MKSPLSMIKTIFISTLLFTLSVTASASSQTRAMDHAEIIELSSKYAWGIDTLDKELLATVFIPSAFAHYEIVNTSVIKLDEKLEGFDEIYQWLKKNLGHRKGHDGLPWHFVTNHVVDITNDTAVMRFYMHNRPMAAGGVYTFKLIRATEGWRVKALKLDEQIWDLSPYQKRK